MYYKLYNYIIQYYCLYFTFLKLQTNKSRCDLLVHLFSKSQIRIKIEANVYTIDTLYTVLFSLLISNVLSVIS